VIALTPAGAAAQSSDGSGGAPFDIRTVSTVVPLRTDNGDRALAVYRALIPSGLQMPAHPIVGLWLSELSTVRSNDARPMDQADHWIEGAIEIRVRHDKEEGWYPILYPVTAEFWFQAGRTVGLPKRHATASIAPAGGGWLAQATPSGAPGPSISMAWQPGPNTDPAATNLAFKAALDPLLVLNAPLQGPDVERVQYVASPPSALAPAIPGGAPAYGGDPNGPVQPGPVKVHLAPDTDTVQEADLPRIFPPGSTLADVVNTDQTIPGDYYFYAINLSDTSSVVGKGGYSPRHPIPTSATQGTRVTHAPRAPRRCVSRRSIVLRVAKAELSVVRAYVNGRRVKARILKGGRVRLSLGAGRAGPRRVRVVAQTRSGAVVVRSATYRICARRSPKRHKTRRS